MSYLRDIGDVYLVDWQEIEDPNHRLDDYVKEVCQALSFVNKATSAKIDIIGHCIGGNLALAACIINQIYINSLTLLTTPWDFSHLSGIFTVNKYLNLNNNVKSLPKIPKLYIQILFFLLFPNYFNIKLDKYFKLTNNRDKEFFLRVEDWLMSGNSLPNKAYFQIINDIEQNKQSKTKWVIDDIIIEPKLLNKKIYMVIATDDQVVPKSSVLPLYQSFEAAELIELPGGHISYLINDQVEKFFTVYTS